MVIEHNMPSTEFSVGDTTDLLVKVEGASNEVQETASESARASHLTQNTAAKRSRRCDCRERGFTLIELLTVLGIIGVVSALGMTSFYVYRSDAAYAVASRLVADGAQGIEGTLSVPDQAFAAVTGYTQSTQGPISDSTAQKALPGVMVPRKMKFQFSFDPSCSNAACVLASVQANHCQGIDYPRWIRYGDGVTVRLEHVAGVGCN